MRNCFLGIEIGGTKMQIVSGNEAGLIEERFRFAVQPAGGAGGIRRQIEETLRDLAPRLKPSAIGVGFGGPVDWRKGVICCSHHIEEWSDFPLGPWLRDLAGAPVYIDNDAVVYSLLGLRYIDLRSQLFDSERLMDEALDKYTFIRDAYLQHRNYLITGNEQDNGSLYVDDVNADNAAKADTAVGSDYVD